MQVESWYGYHTSPSIDKGMGSVHMRHEISTVMKMWTVVFSSLLFSSPLLLLQIIA
jgi:hypothetical protein